MREYRHIGISPSQVKIGKEVYYYSWWDKETQSHSEPIKTEITSKEFWIGENWTCKVAAISGVVSLSHLSDTYYPAQTVKHTKAMTNYQEFLKVGDCYGSFAQYNGIVLPRIQYESYKGYLVSSRKYSNVKGEFCKTLKAAKQSYKESLNKHLKLMRINKKEND